MKLRKLTILIAILAIGLFDLLTVRASPGLAPKFPDVPLLIAVRKGQRYSGDIWAWRGSELLQRTGSGLCFVPIVSPTGEAFVYEQIPAAFAKPGDSEEDTEDRPVPLDIYITDLKTARTSVIAGQPKDASFSGNQIRYTLRSEPSWSADGKLLAWTELTLGQAARTEGDLQAESLMVYDVSTKAVRTLIPKLPIHRTVGEDPALSELMFGPENLIAVKVHISQDTDNNWQDTLYFYDGSGKQLGVLEKLEKLESAYESSQMIWLSGMEKPYLSCIACTTKIDPFSGKGEAMNGAPELFSALAPDKLSLYYGGDSGDEANVTWIIALNGEQVSKFDSVRIANLRDVAISADGMQVASANYVGQGSTAGVFIYRAASKQTRKITLNVIGLGWGPMAWRVHHSSAETGK